MDKTPNDNDATLPRKIESDSNEASSEDDEDEKSGSCESSQQQQQSGQRGVKRGRDRLTDEEKKAERRAANRRSAFQSRQRRKILIEDLQKTVGALSKDNSDLRKSNDDLRTQLEAALLENQQYRMKQQLANSSNNNNNNTNTNHSSGGSVASSSAPVPASSVSDAIKQAQSARQQASSFLSGGQGAGSSGLTNAQLLSAGLGGINPGGESDALLKARIALAAAQARVCGGLGALGGGGGGGGDLGGLQGLLESARGGTVGGGGGGGLSDIQRALLQGAAGPSPSMVGSSPWLGNNNSTQEALLKLFQQSNQNA